MWINSIWDLNCPCYSSRLLLFLSYEKKRKNKHKFERDEKDILCTKIALRAFALPNFPSHGIFLRAASHPLGSFWGLQLLEYEVECRCTLFICPEIICSRFVVWNICRPSTHFPFEDRKVACREATCQCQRIWTLLLFQCRPQWPWMKTKYLVIVVFSITVSPLMVWIRGLIFSNFLKKLKSNVICGYAYAILPV